MSTALVTGTIDRVHAVAMALKREGFDALAWEGSMPGMSDGLPPRSVDCYVQLAPGVAPSPASGGESEPGALVGRVDTVASLSPLLAPDGAVVLVADERGWDPSRRRALHALAGATVAERVGKGVRVAVVDSGEAGFIAATARRELGLARAPSLADFAPGLGYADWRHEVLNLTSGTEPTYFGWLGPDGVRRVAVLRGSVLSPVFGVNDGVHGLARAMLTDTIGASGGEGLQQWAEGLAGDFHDEVAGSLPVDGFELPVHEVAAWVVRRSLLNGCPVESEVNR